MTKHSKGRLARNIPPITKYPTLYAGRNEHVCVVTTRGVKPEVAEANADHLVACWNMHADLSALFDHGYCVGRRDPVLIAMLLGNDARIRTAKIDGAYMIYDPADNADGYLLIGDDLPALLREACEHLGLMS